MLMEQPWLGGGSKWSTKQVQVVTWSGCPGAETLSPRTGERQQ